MISCVILTKNEEKKIRECLRSLESFDELIVIDDYSSDKTRDFSRKEGATVYKRKLDSSFAAQRNFGLKKAQGEWVVFVDADELVSDDLAKEIVEKTSTCSKDVSGFLVKRQDVLWGKRLLHGEVGNVKLLRLARKGTGTWCRNVHEVWDVKGRVLKLDNVLEHYPHPKLSLFLEELNNYSTLHAGANKVEGKDASIFKVAFYPVMKFLYTYFLKLGVLDGIEGFLVSIMMSVHSFLAWSKLWLKQNK